MTGMHRGGPIRVLVYQIGSLGDTLVAVPAYKAIRRHFGSAARISVIHNIPADVRAMPQQVLSGSGLVDEFIGFHQTGGRSNLRDSLELWSKVARLKADAVVYLAPADRGVRSVLRDRLFFHLCGVRQTIGFRAIDPEILQTRDSSGRRRPVPHEGDLRLDRLKREGIRTDFDDSSAGQLNLEAAVVDAMRARIDTQRLWPARRLFAVAPGANQPAKYWPLERFDEIGRRVIDTGQYEPVIIGGPREVEAGEKLTASWGAGLNLAGKCSVLESAALLSLCKFLIGLDTGTTHLSAAVGTPVVTLYADRDRPGQWLPMGDQHIVLRQEVPCGGCRLMVCNQEGHPCMTQITVDAVWEAVERVSRLHDASCSSVGAVSG